MLVSSQLMDTSWRCTEYLIVEEYQAGLTGHENSAQNTPSDPVPLSFFSTVSSALHPTGSLIPPTEPWVTYRPFRIVSL